MRRRAANRERARLGRELHDGIVQGLIAVDMELEAARRRATGISADVLATFETVQVRLRSELASLRAVVNESRCRDLAPALLSQALSDVVWRFEQETEIPAAFASNLETAAIRLPRRVCGELVCILREAMANVRRHSHARNVWVEFTGDDMTFTLSIEDDGRGLIVGRPPTVIRERVDLIGGHLTLAPVTRGARLEITVPRTGPWRSAS
jgi:signal transduction histidine kinase